VHNANHVLASIIAALHDDQGRVTVPGFYDDVLEPAPEESESWKRLPRTDEQFMETAGAFALWGEEGRSNEERIWARPTLEIVGMTGGYQGPGHMGVVPCEAIGRMSTRLVPNQDPAKIVPAVRAHIVGLAPEGVEVTVKHGSGIGAVRIPTDTPWVKAATRALRTGFEAEPVFIREGGSIPIVKMFIEDLGLPCLLLGFGLPDDRIHGPNEKFSLENFHAGTRTAAALLHELSEVTP
jgi:acetylornithine deacetylase/succinyl-diaminopimelate desuccinylase-like protein